MPRAHRNGHPEPITITNTEASIASHVWRPRLKHGRCWPECGYMNCLRPRVEHQRSVPAGEVATGHS